MHFQDDVNSILRTLTLIKGINDISGKTPPTEATKMNPKPPTSPASVPRLPAPNAPMALEAAKKPLALEAAEKPLALEAAEKPLALPPVTQPLALPPVKQPLALPPGNTQKTLSMVDRAMRSKNMRVALRYDSRFNRFKSNRFTARSIPLRDGEPPLSTLESLESKKKDSKPSPKKVGKQEE